MPGSVLGSQLSWAAYMFAAAGLILVAGPTLTGTLQSSTKSTDLRVLTGLRDVVEELSPGVAVNLTIPSGVTGSSINLQGDIISLTNGNTTISTVASVTFASAHLLPGRSYSFQLVGGVVEAGAIG